MQTANRYYVKAVTSKGRVIGYGVYDCVGGMESEHACYPIADDGDRDSAVALHLANTHRDDLNAGIA